MYQIDDITIFDEEEEKIKNLTKFSHQRVSVICPFCRKRREVFFGNVHKVGHTFCKKCSKIQQMVIPMIGKTFGNFFVLSIAPSKIDKKSGKSKTQIYCRCVCGKTTIVKATDVRNGTVESCGCVFLSKLRGQVGSKNPRYNHNMTDDERQQQELRRKSGENRAWKASVKEHFGSHCFLCGSTENIHVHHVESFREHPELRYNVQNGVCLCKKCHFNYHILFLGGVHVPATKESFTRYMEWYLCQLQNY